MRAVRLIAAEDEYDCEPGLIIKGTPQCEGMMADRDSGMLIAHDLLEHVNGVENIGQIDDELQALGAIWYVRGRHGDLLSGNNFHTPAVNVASDLTRMFRDLGSCRYWPGVRTPRTYRHDYDEDFLEIIAIARRDIPREADSMNRTERELMEAYLTDALHYMRTGYRKAQRRFERRRNEYNWKAPNQFAAIRDAVKACRPEYVGQEFVLTYGNGEARCVEYPGVWQ